MGGRVSRPQIDALTGVRGIAAWWVVLYHIRAGIAWALPAPVVAVFAKGYVAVDLFFVLSGFVLWLTWGQRFAADGRAAIVPFLRKRIARVWPLHAVVLAATVAFALVIQASGRPLPAHYRWEELPLHVLLIQNWGLTRDLAWNDPSWSISTELAAYFGFAMLAVRRPGVQRGTYSATGPGLRPGDGLLIVLLILFLDRLFAWAGSDSLGFDIPRLGLVRCLVEFACGVIACRLWQRHGARVVAPSIAIAATMIALWATGLARETFAIPLAFAALVPLLAATSGWRLNPLSSRIAVTLGEISYSTYLAHFLLWTLFKIALVRDAAVVPILVVALYLALTLAASFALHRVVEVPARDLLSGNRRAAQRLRAA